jgi:hypothetical protein
MVVVGAAEPIRSDTRGLPIRDLKVMDSREGTLGLAFRLMTVRRVIIA